MFDLRNCKKSEISNSNCLELTEELLNKIAPKRCVSRYSDIHIQNKPNHKMKIVLRDSNNKRPRN